MERTEEQVRVGIPCKEGGNDCHCAWLSVGEGIDVSFLRDISDSASWYLSQEQG